MQVRDYMNVAQFVVRRGDRDHVPCCPSFYADSGDYFHAPHFTELNYKCRPTLPSSLPSSTHEQGVERNRSTI